jgi:hypothetical protein
MPTSRKTGGAKAGPNKLRRGQSSDSTAYQLRVTLLGIRPPIWRRILVPPDASAEYLHHVIQVAMGWHDSHLHHFLLGTRPNLISIEPPDSENDGDYPTLDSYHLSIRDLLRRGGGRGYYEYDFGDGWAHVIRLEKELFGPPRTGLPHCLDGGRACPPEDCGGVSGYADIVRIAKDPEFEPDGRSREELIEWLGGALDPEAFSLDEVNAQFAPPRRSSLKSR